ncbi:MAG: alpha/beta hydrolase [Alphaproteobacteria bacterium]|nr:alpha/beta hydrolase [Alphaproteobacteria bacterium]
MTTLPRYLYDENHTRFQLVKSVPGKEVINWLFLPGGPGVDSNCFTGLVDSMNAPGNYWLIDLVFNGSNEHYPNFTTDVYKQWKDFLVSAVNKFESPILVGHSFGGYLPLFCPQLEDCLKGLVILNSVPTLQSELFAKCAIENNLPLLGEAQALFVEKPTLKNLKALYLLEAFYFFSSNNQAHGIEQIVSKLEFCLSTEHWWYKEGAQYYSKIKWIPKKVPTIIIGGAHDFITPIGIFQQDLRFNRSNIKMINLVDAGHFPWLEQPQLVNKALTDFCLR